MSGRNVEYLSLEEVEALGFRALGRDVLIHRTAVIVGCERISLGAMVRIDPFTLISAGASVSIGSYVHVSAYASLVGSAEIVVGNYCNLSFGTRILSSSDDFSGVSMTGPQVPDEYRNVHVAPVRIGHHAILGAGTVVLPGMQIGEGVATGVSTLVNRSLAPWTIYVGTPARRLRERRRDLLEAANAFELRNERQA